MTYRRIIAAIDVREGDGETVLRAAAGLLDDRGELCIVSVIEPFSPEADWVMAPSYIEMLEEFEREAVMQSRDKLDALCAACGVVASSICIETGKPVDQILARASDTNAELIAIGSHGRRGLDRLLGSVCNGVVNRSSIDTLVIRVP
jgi:universal stress protein A